MGGAGQNAGGSVSELDAQQADVGPVSVSVVIPCFNEERTIFSVLECLAQQYEASHYEILVVDGMSSDRTREEVLRFQHSYPEINVRVVDNPTRRIPSALNLGIATARGDIIVRMDAHSLPAPTYVHRCVELLRGAEERVVGMPWRIEPGANSLQARAIALAVSHRFGSGDAWYRLDGLRGSREVDTVPFGAFHKRLWTALGGFNEALLTNEDYDYNYRVRQRGGQVLLDASSHCVYYARTTWLALARQYCRYGFWKAQMVKLHPQSIRWRQIVPPLFALALIALPVLAWKAHWALVLLAVMVGAYVLVDLGVSAGLALRNHTVGLMPIVWATFPIVHVAWGASFLVGLVFGPGQRQGERHQVRGRLS